MRRITQFAFGMAAFLAGQAAARADLVTLVNERTIDGIIVRETPESIELRVAWQGFVTFDRGTVVRIARGTPVEHEQLLAQWREEHIAGQQREEAAREYDAAQEARGLVEYNGAWVSPQELLALELREQQQADAKDRRALEEQIRALSGRIDALTHENDDLRRRLHVSRERVVLWPQPVIVHGQRHGSRDRDRDRDGRDGDGDHSRRRGWVDDQGNRVRLRREGGDVFVETRDGKRFDVRKHEDHLAYTDDQGVHHDVKRPN